jgi:HEPN domain-containing protein
MRHQLRNLFVIGLLAAGASACDDSPTAPGGESNTELGVNADMELQVVGDPELTEVLIDDMSLSMNSPTDGPPFGNGRECFRDARQLLREGSEDAARNQARECRMQLVRAMLERHGEEGLEELFGRVEGLIERIGEADDEFARKDDLEARMRGLLEEAYAYRNDGDLVAAGERLVLALMMADRMRHRHPEFDRDPAEVVRLAIARGVESIWLADELITEPTVRQETILFRAGELLRRARFSAEQGWYRRAVGQAHRAEQLGLLAVLNGERPTVEQAQELLAVAEELIVLAEEAIGDDPTELQQRLLAHAIRLKERGAEAINTWHWRGVGLLWRSSVTSALLIPNPTDSA